MTSFKRKGFTLVELLIVIVVIGVLSTMMMLSSTEAVTSAKAAKIISNMRNLKTATLAWYTDNFNKIVPLNGQYGIGYGIIQSNGQTVSMNDFFKNNTSEILAYLSNGNNSGAMTLKTKRDTNIVADDYVIKDVDTYKKWYICYYVGNDKRLQEKLASKAESLGMLGIKTIADDIKSNTKNIYTNHNFACVMILSLGD